MCRVALFLLSTGCRLNEALSATWADVEIERRVFTIRATNSKSRKIRSVPLNDSAIEVLNGLDTQARRRIRCSSAVAAGSAKRGKRSPRSPSSGTAYARWPVCRTFDCTTCGISFASFLVNDGRTLYEVQAILGHARAR